MHVSDSHSYFTFSAGFNGLLSSSTLLFSISVVVLPTVSIVKHSASTYFAAAPHLEKKRKVCTYEREREGEGGPNKNGYTFV